MTTLRKSMRQEAGFTIVEMMVGVLIGLVAIVVMFQVFAVSEGQRRTTTGAGDAQQNGVTSLYIMERDIRLAGYGLNYLLLLGCRVNGYWNPTAKTFNFTYAPVIITNGGGGTLPDSITVLYGSTDSFALPSALANPTDKTAGFFRVKDARYQFNTGDLIVMADVPVPTTPVTPLRNCSLFQVTDLPAVSSGRGNDVVISGNFYIDSNGTNRPAKYTPPSAGGTTQPPPNNLYYPVWKVANVLGQGYGGRAANLGSTPTLVRYSIVNNQLQAQDLLDPDAAAIPISDGIVQLQAQYGFAASCPFVPPLNAPPCTISPTAVQQQTLDPTQTTTAGDHWASQLPATMTPADWRRILAIRMVVVARSGEKEKVDPVTGVCNATATMPVWSVTGLPIDIGADPNWKCYRYRTFETVVPIRNMIWYPDPSGNSIPPA